MKRIFSKKLDRGSILLTTVLFCFFLLMIAFTLTAIFLPKIKVSRDVKYSSMAIYAADTGIEYCLYVSRQSEIEMPVFEADDPDDPEDFKIVLQPPDDCSAIPLRSTGVYKGVVRTFEISMPEE